MILFIILFELLNISKTIQLPKEGFYRYRIFANENNIFLLDYYEGNIYDLEGNIVKTNIFNGIDPSYCKKYIINPLSESQEYIMISFDYLLEEKPFPFLIIKKKDFDKKEIIMTNFYEKIESATIYKGEIIVNVPAKALISKLKYNNIEPLCKDNEFFKEIDYGIGSGQNLCFLKAYKEWVICSFMKSPIMLFINPETCEYKEIDFSKKINEKLAKGSYLQKIAKTILIGDELYIFLGSKGSRNDILIYNLLNNDFKNIKIGLENEFYEWYVFKDEIYAIDEKKLFIFKIKQ